MTVNDFALHCALMVAPFGGLGRSGWGAYCGKAGFDTFTHHRTVTVSRLPFSIARMMMPPYSAAMTSGVSGYIRLEGYRARADRACGGEGCRIEAVALHSQRLQALSATRPEKTVLAAYGCQACWKSGGFATLSAMGTRQYATNHNEHVIVTGAASGIGRQAVGRLRSQSSRVTAVDLDPGVVDAHAGDPQIPPVVGDVTDPEFCRSMVELAEAVAPVTALFHSAGIMPGGEIASVAAEDILRVMAVNYGGTVTAIKSVLPVMRHRRRGRIVVMGSLTGYFPTNKFAAYSASKAAVNIFAEILAQEERCHGIEVLLVAPNAVRTPLLRQAVGGPAEIARIDSGQSRGGMSTKQVLDEIDQAIESRKAVVLPGGRVPYLLRRLSPRLSWFFVSKINR